MPKTAIMGSIVGTPKRLVGFGESIFFEAIDPARNPIYIFPRHAQGGGAGPDFLRNSPLIRCRPAL